MGMARDILKKMWAWFDESNRYVLPPGFHRKGGLNLKPKYDIPKPPPPKATCLHRKSDKQVVVKIDINMNKT